MYTSMRSIFEVYSCFTPFDNKMLKIVSYYTRRYLLSSKPHANNATLVSKTFKPFIKYTYQCFKVLQIRCKIK